MEPLTFQHPHLGDSPRCEFSHRAGAGSPFCCRGWEMSGNSVTKATLGASPLGITSLTPVVLLLQSRWTSAGSTGNGPPLLQSCKLVHMSTSALHRASGNYRCALDCQQLTTVTRLLLTMLCNYFVQVGSLQLSGLWADKSFRSYQCWSSTRV